MTSLSPSLQPRALDEHDASLERGELDRLGDADRAGRGASAPPVSERRRSTRGAHEATADDVAAEWKARFGCPFDRAYRYPIARRIVSVLMHTPVTPNQVTTVQLAVAAVGAWFVSRPSAHSVLIGAALFEVRAILDCVDGTLARAKRMSSPTGHAIDALADWLGSVFLFAGMYVHLSAEAQPALPWGGHASVLAVLLLSLLQGATRSFAHDYWKTKYVSIFGEGHDECVEGLRKKVLALREAQREGRASVFAHVEVFIGRMGHLSFHGEWFDPERSGLHRVHLERLRGARERRSMRALAVTWSLSSGDTFLAYVILTIAAGQMWGGQVFFATAGIAWIFGLLMVNSRYFRKVAEGA